MSSLLRLPFGLLGLAALAVSLPAGAPLASPDGRLAVTIHLTPDGEPRYTVQRDGVTVLADSRLGLIRDDADFTRSLQLLTSSAVEPVEDRYELLTGKRRLNTYHALRQTHQLATADGHRLDLIFQISDDGVAFRYGFPETDPAPHQIREEVTSFRFPTETKAWLQPMAPAKSGWMRTNPSYEEHYQQGIAAGTPSTLGAGWVFPALFQTGDTWVLLTETALGRTYCGSRLRHDSPGGEYVIGFPDPRETIAEAPVNPVSSLPWLTPWRLVAVGDLATITESTLGTDLAIPAAEPADPAIRPGKASWSWPLLGDDQTVDAVQRRFIDYAADMGWAYCLIDALWDKQIGYDKIKELADYARTRNVGLLLWYNTNGTWNDAPQTPKDRMATPAARHEEFTRLRAMGIKGIKVDFFGGDGQPMINLYHDILQDAAPFGLLVNFHGCTLPRGWSRTYPHLMTMEAIKGFEFLTFDQANADAEAVHAATIPFTRNVFDPMDFTPMCLDRLPGDKQRRTTAAFELALAVLFTSGIQHYPEIPEGMAKAPDYVQDYLRRLPSIWDDSKLIAGFPGEYAVIARQGEGRWHIAGINAAHTPRTLTLDLHRLATAGRGTLIIDRADGTAFETRPLVWTAGESPTVTLAAQGGFVLVLE